MEPHDKYLEQALADSGWMIRDRLEGPGWWAAALWSLESVWRPRGLQLYLVFLVDPMAPIGAHASDNVWSVAVSRTIPTSPHEQWTAELSLGHGWNDRVPELLSALARLRDAEPSAV